MGLFPNRTVFSNEKEAELSTVPTGAEDEQIEVIAPGVEWNPEEEKALVRKLDCVVMPLLIAGFFVLQLDRSNVGNALTDNFFKDVEISQFDFNVGKQIMYLGVVLFEIPSNLVLYKVGPAIWIGCQILAWGMVATFQAWQKGRSAFLACRFLLGACESGYIPAALYTITRFYTRNETSKRFGLFYLGNMVANACGGLIAYGILHMRGVSGLTGWQWLFLIEGMMTLFLAIAFIAFFPRGTHRPVSLMGLRYFSERESQVLTARVLRDDPSKQQVRQHISREEFMAAITNWRSIVHIVLSLTGMSATTSLFSYAPSIVASYGFENLKANAMTSIGYWILLFTTLFWGWAADAWGKRGPMVFIGVFIGFILIVANRCVIDSGSNTVKFVIITLITGFSFNWNPVNASWMALNAKSAGERSITMAIFVMSTNASGIVGGQIFQEYDKPLYRTAWTVVMSLSCIAVVCTIVANVQYWANNKKLDKEGREGWRYKP